MQAPFEQLAQALAKAWNAGATIALPAAQAAPRSRCDAFAIQDRMAEILGDRCVGWKVGAAVPAVQVMEGHDGPITGRLFAARQHASPAQLDGTMFEGYKIECEFAFRFTRNVPARERKATTHDLIADNGACGAYVEGVGIEDWRRIDFAAVPIDARIDGGEPIETFSGAYFRDPVDILVETVNGLSLRGLAINSGDLLTTGSLTLPTPMRPGQTYVARFGELATLRLSFR